MEISELWYGVYFEFGVVVVVPDDFEETEYFLFAFVFELYEMEVGL